MLRAAVIGVGRMGERHARVLAGMAGVELVAVADPDGARREAARAGRPGVRAYRDHGELLAREAIDVAVVAVPIGGHHEVVRAVIARGVHVLVEKPLAATVAEGVDLVERAAAAGCALGVGHVERWNAAIVEARRRLAGGALGRVRQIQTRRLGPPPAAAHARASGVALELATHDLDVMRHLVGEPVARVHAEAARAACDDLLVGCVRFAGGAIGSLSADWTTPARVRDCRVTAERGVLVADYLTQDLAWFPAAEAPGATSLAIARGDPLRDELAAFVGAVAARRAPPVTGLDGLRAVALAELLLESAACGQAIDVRAHAARRGWPALLGAGEAL